MTHASSAPTRDAGFTLAEVLVALLLLTVAAIGTAGLATTSLRGLSDARLETTRVAAATQKLEQLLSLAWTLDPHVPGSAIVDAATDLSRDPATVGGPGLGAVPAGSLTANLPGFADYLDARGQWLSDGTSRPPGAVFLRRWQLSRVPAATSAVVALQVFVTSAGQPGLPLAGQRSRDVLLTTLRTRKAL